MRSRLSAVTLAAAAAFLAAPASSQGTGDQNIPTETQERMAQRDNDVPWGLAGLLGLLGLFGLRRRGHAEDGYHPAPVE